MMGSFLRLPARAVGRRIDAEYYRPEYVSNADRLAASPIACAKFQTLVTDGRRTLYFGTETLDDDQAPDEWVPFLTADDLGDEGFFVETRSRRRVSPTFLSAYPVGRLRSGELLVKVKGPNQTAAYVDVAPPYPVLVSGTIWGGIVRKDVVDPHYLVAALSSPYGATARSRLRTNLNVEFTSADDLLALVLPIPHRTAQRYIGEKIRQAERLRERARQQRQTLDALLNVEGVAAAVATSEGCANRVPAADLNPRLDAKYYGTRAMAVLRAASTDSQPLGALVQEVSNGFEHREFVDHGTPYITVSEVSGGRLILDGAPRIAAHVAVPDKARIDSSCALVVRTGSIGVAVKVFDEDASASISSHLIRLKCASDSAAAVVAAYLNSDAGATLQRKIAYGAVQPQIGQDELLALPVPRILLKRADAILHALQTEDGALREAARLTLAAKLIVEQLIDGNVFEVDLVAAQKALDSGDRGADRALLLALRRGEGASALALFTDLDALYALLDDGDAPGGGD